jgi:hypothetical protein
MGLQLLNRPYASLSGYEQPKILKNIQGEYRDSRRSPNVDIGSIFDSIRFNNDKNRFIQEHVSKYSQGLNPYGDTGGEVYKVNKQFRPPIIPMKEYEALSRMPVKFDNVGAGAIISSPFNTKLQVNQVVPKTIISRVCADASTNVSLPIQAPTNEQCRNKDLPQKIPRASIPYWPSIPVHINRPGTGIPEIELNPQIFIRPNMNIHAPFNISDQSRDVNNMRTPTHIAMNPNIKMPGAVLDYSQFIQYPDLTPKVQTAAWYNPSYFLADPNTPEPDEKCLRTPLHVAGTSNVSWINQEAERGVTTLDDPLHPGSFEPKVYGSQIDPHSEYRSSDLKTEAKRVDHIERFQTPVYESYNSNPNNYSAKSVKDTMKLQEPRVDKTYIRVYEG